MSLIRSVGLQNRCQMWLEAGLEFLRTAALIIATMSVGFMAGVMALYANTLMPGLAETDDRTFVGAFQAIDRRIINPFFLATFMGALIFTGLSALLHLQEESPIGSAVDRGRGSTLLCNGGHHVDSQRAAQRCDQGSRRP